MKKFTSLLLGCSLALAGAAFAQQPEEQQSPTTKQGTEAATGKHHGAKAERAEAKAGESATANPEAATGKHHGAKTEQAGATSGASATANPDAAAGKHHGAKAERAAAKTQGAEATTSSQTGAGGETKAAATPALDATSNGKHGKGKNARMNAKAAASATPATSAAASATPATTAVASATPASTVAASATPAVAASASAAPSVAVSGQQQNGRMNAGTRTKTIDVQKVQQIKTQHANFRAQARPQQVPTVTFNQSYRIEGSDRWQGQQYEVFRSYHPERHDEGFYRSHYSRVEQIGGGYYYFNNGYWYPAWGYSPSAEYYAYDGPIYVGHRSEPPDRVIADVQSELQEMGYYKGEVDGLLGPMTREALTAYQSEQGLTATAAIDEPTLDALGMG